MIESLAALTARSGVDIYAVQRATSTAADITGVSKPSSWLIDALAGGQTASGRRVGPDTAMQSTAVYACVRLLSETIASLPLFLYERMEDRRRRASSHRLYSLLHDAPNPWQTSLEWREMMQGHVLLRGNAYSYIVRDGFGEVVSIIPLHPDYVTILKGKDGEPYYRVDPNPYTSFSGKFSRLEIFHLRGMSSDGYCGMSPIGWARESVALALTAQEHGARLFSNGAQPRGALELPAAPKPEMLTRIREQWEAAYGGVRNSSKVAIFEPGMKWHAIGMTNEDAQYLQLRAFENHQIYQIYGVPPHMVGDNEKTTSWGTGIEQLSIGFVTYTLRSHLVRWEQSISQSFLLPEERAALYAEFEVDGLLRGDQKSRAEALAIRRQNGIINANEWRRLENMDPINGPEGEAYVVNGNMRSLTQILNTPEAPNGQI